MVVKVEDGVFAVVPTFVPIRVRACLAVTASHYAWRPMGTQD
jgi:hypothetical protein